MYYAVGIRRFNILIEKPDLTQLGHPDDTRLKNIKCEVFLLTIYSNTSILPKRKPRLQWKIVTITSHKTNTADVTPTVREKSGP